MEFAIEKVPAGHGVGLVVMFDEHEEPAGQGVHNADDILVYVPGAQGKLVDEKVLGQYRPSGHDVHEPLPSSANVPV